MAMSTNGTAIWGGCVTRRRTGLSIVPLGPGAVPVREGHGGVFAREGATGFGIAL
jgi:hypothetical protein